MAGLNTGKAKAGGKAEPAGLGSLLLRALICVCLLSALVMTFFVVDVRLHTSNLMAWIDANPTRGFFVFIAFYSLATGTLLLRRGGARRATQATAAAVDVCTSSHACVSVACVASGRTDGLHSMYRDRSNGCSGVVSWLARVFCSEASCFISSPVLICKDMLFMFECLLRPISREIICKNVLYMLNVCCDQSDEKHSAMESVLRIEDLAVLSTHMQVICTYVI